MNATLRCFLTAGLLAATSTAACARIERLVEKTFNVGSAGTLRIETAGGEVRVAAGGDGMVKITARQRINADTDAEADELLKKLEFSIEQSGNDVTARAKYERQRSEFHWGSWPPVRVDFIVTIPANFAADLHTSGGGITVGDLAGRVTARTSGGGIKLGKMGSTVDARTSGGNVTLEAARGDVELSSSGGNIDVGRVDGTAEISTSGGGIKIESVEGRVNARTSGGSIRAGIAGPLKGDCALSTSGGSVRVNVDKSAAFRLAASTSGGGVDAEGLTLTLEKSSRNRSTLSGSVNGGGPTLKLRSSGGDIVVRAN